MFKTRIDDFFHTVKFRAPEIFHFLKADIHVRTEFPNASIGIAQAGRRALLIKIPTSTRSMVGAVLKAIVRISVSVISPS